MEVPPGRQAEVWINERMKGKDARKALTDEWQRTGVSGQQYNGPAECLTLSVKDSYAKVRTPLP